MGDLGSLLLDLCGFARGRVCWNMRGIYLCAVVQQQGAFGPPRWTCMNVFLCATASAQYTKDLNKSTILILSIALSALEYF